MNENGLLDICDAMGLKSGPSYTGSDKWGPHISISCPLALIRHNDSYDWNTSCSVSVSDDEPSLVRCWSFNCKFKGNLYSMLKLAIEARGNPENLVGLLKKIEPLEKFTLESSLARGKKLFEAKLDEMRRPTTPVFDKDILPEARLQRFRSSIPRYAISRGLTRETCNTWELGFDKENKRLIFPVRRHDGKLVGLTGRILPSAQDAAEAEGRSVSKYHNYAGLDKTKYLFGEHLLRQGEPVILVEGQIDAILTWQNLGIPAVAPLGEGFSVNHVRTISAFEPPVVYIFPDSDNPGRMAAEKFEYALHGRVPMKLMVPPEGMDPGEMTKEEMLAALAASVTILGKIKWE